MYTGSQATFAGLSIPICPGQGPSPPHSCPPDPSRTDSLEGVSPAPTLPVLGANLGLLFPGKPGTLWGAQKRGFSPVSPSRGPLSVKGPSFLRTQPKGEEEKAVNPYSTSQNVF